ncbi:bifunctional adenosylcobinamide kinase/adenosylcobinamide-phosphate guanylyltransferase [Gymnodinialimonas sp. 2305UL16-5]|uniref:bifunctional adenosylcobinamide kinase/adenosylcobinamide-phosphate guanylyltransferase n=1 Tax=Gymnodinialimonas mytili TaxID=3126503 RepID=UPI0030AB2341
MRLPPLTLVLGGAASGKSAFAEDLLGQSGLAKVYVATAEAFDAEMATKIAAHRQLRAGQGWRTIEAPRDAVRALAEVQTGEAVLLDCMTFWLSNLMLQNEEWESELDALSDAFRDLPGPLVAVSNEVSGGIVPENALARAFQRAQGAVNQRLARQADLVVQVTAGLPMVLKGQLEGPAW